jgi:hypothetical protein
MTLLHPYPPNPDYTPWSVGSASIVGEEAKYTFTSYESLVDYFTQWLPQDFVASIINNEKQIFVVRKEVSLEETRLQFLKRCENVLIKTLTEIQNGHSQDWGYGVQSSP